MTAGIEEDLSDRKILEGGTNFRWAYKQKFWSVWLPSREGVKDNKNVIWDLSLSLLECVNNHLSAAAGNFLQVANEIVGNYCRDYPLNDQPPFLSGLSVVLIKIFLAKAVYMVIGSSYLSAKKILVRGS